MPRPGDRAVITNRKARHEYEVLETWQCGIALVGCEVKSLREGKGNLLDAYARIQDGELFLYGMHILPYPMARDHPDPTRPRKLLAHRREIDELASRSAEPGMTLVPLKVYFHEGIAKVELALARGRKRWDKRQAIATRDAKREADRALKQRNR